MKVLILHRLGNPLTRRRSVETLELLFPKNYRKSECIVHDVNIPPPDFLKKINFDLIILGPTFLGARLFPIVFNKIIKTFAFVKTSKAIKVALPQDEYDSPMLLDKWLSAWMVSVIYTVLEEKYTNLLYPECSKKIKILPGFTYYLDESEIKKWNITKSAESRNIDVFYRASKLPKKYGELGYLKYIIAKRFLNNAKRIKKDYNYDISINLKDTLYGNKWIESLENSKFCLATPSGSSQINLINQFEKNLFLLKFPTDQLFGKFSAISPRHIEAAMTETNLIATEGYYSNLMQKNKDYICLDDWCANIEDVFHLMENKRICDDIKRNLKKNILQTKRLRSSFIADEIASFIGDVSRKKQSQKETILIEKYNNKKEIIEKKFWSQRNNVSFIQKIKNISPRFVKQLSLQVLAEKYCVI